MANRSTKLLLRIILAGVVVAAVIVGVRWRAGGDAAQAAHKDGGGDSEAGGKRGGAGKSGGAGRAVTVAVVPVTARDVPLWLEGLGSVAAWQQVTVRPQVDGRLDKVFFKEGQAVKKGDLLAQIDPRPFAVQLHQAEGAFARDKAQLAAAQLNLDRYRTLAQQKLISQQQADDQAALAGQAAGAVQADQASIESARLNLDYARVNAPLDGVVGVRQVDAGNLVHATDANGLVVITQLDPMAMFVTLPEDDLPQIMAAMQRGEVPVEAWSRDGTSKLAIGKLAVVDNQINATTATLRLKCQLPNDKRTLWPNQFVKARLLLEVRKNALTMPPSAIQRGPEGAFVYVVAGGKAELRPVQVALTTADMAVIDKGLVAGDQVVVEGQNQLRPGVTVNARPLAPKGDASGDAKAGAGGRSAGVGSNGHAGQPKP